MVRPSLRAALVFVASAFVAPSAFAQMKNPPSCDAPDLSNQDISCTPLAQTIAAILADHFVAQDHWGIAVIGMDGVPLYSLNAAQLFQPASNAKLFTTAAALALLGAQTVYQTRVLALGSVAPGNTITGDLAIIGVGDANLSGRTLPYTPPSELQMPETAPAIQPPPLRYLEFMADQVAASGVKTVTGDIIGDDTFFPWQPYASDWTIDDAVWGYGAPVSALSVNDNQIQFTITPGIAAGAAAIVTLDPPVPYYAIASSVTTGVKRSPNTVGIDRAQGSKTVRVYGSIAVNAQPEVDDIAIEDPAEYAAVAFKAMLEARGITVSGRARPRHRILLDTENFLRETNAASGVAGQPDALQQIIAPSDAANSGTAIGTVKPLATHTSPPLLQDIVVTNKVSQNLHAELLLRQLGAAKGRDGSIAQGALVVRQFLLGAGIDEHDFVFFDGSGLSAHDLVTPRATTRLLQYAAQQPWFIDWKSSLPVGGVDRALEKRFSSPPLKGNVFAKTGTLGEARALSGYVVCASGRTVIFSIMVGNHLPQTHHDRDAMDSIVAAIAAQN